MDAFGQDTVNLSYTYPATANDGRAETMTDQSLAGGVAVNETVSYGYDALKRLTSATTTGPQWGVSYGYDGFGNLLSQTVTKGTGPTQFSLSVNPFTNRVNNYGAGGYDANGNVINDTVNTYGWDAENRLESVNGVKRYSYSPENLRVFDGTHYYFYAPDGRRLGKYSVVNGAWQTDEVYVYFHGRMIATGITAQTTTTTGVIFYPVVTDRVGSVRLGRSGAMNYYPYGQERTATTNGKDKFGTYWRDALTGLDYAQQRYYSAGVGRFLSADPSTAWGGVGNSSSWNRYAYVEGDPVNFNDPSGLAREGLYRDDFSPSIIAVQQWTAEGPVTVHRFLGPASSAMPHGGTFISLALESELRCEQASAPELSESDLEEFLGGVEMDADERAELFEPSAGKDDGRNYVLPAFAGAAATAANWVVYWARTPQGQYYIGVTSQWAQRQAAHAARGLDIARIQGIQALNYAAAKGVEQNLLESFRRNGAQLLNKINSISPHNRFYQQFTGMGHQVLRDCRAKLPDGFPWP